ncbi:hypothetical protein M3Y97_01051800 [Aphelenchoides bicaudatus]|nr:hypothetical protein M3Y97_01051800 [Aphelenchoides bicaudatus]
MHRYLDPEAYEDGVDANHMVGSYLIGISILFGFFVEKNFKRVLVFVKNWRHLFKLLFLFYLTSGVSLFFLHRDALDLFEVNRMNVIKNVNERINTTLMLWRTRNNDKPFPKKDTMWLNKEIAYIDLTCRNRTVYIPTSFKDWSSFDDFCTEKGNGTKNIVVLGNSHAYLSFIGVAEMFKPIAREIVLFGTPACVLGSKQHQYYKMDPLTREKCVNFSIKALKVLQRYNHRIDIIIPLFGWYDFLPFSNVEATKLQSQVQQFYNTLSNLTREVVFAPKMNLVFSKHPLRELQNKLIKNKTIGNIGDTKNKILTIEPVIRRVMDTIECPKCLRIDWFDLWCNNDGYCSAIDNREIGLFMDEHHPTTYGSLYIGEFLLNKYNDYMKRKH